MQLKHGWGWFHSASGIPSEHAVIKYQVSDTVGRVYTQLTINPSTVPVVSFRNVIRLNKLV